MPYTGDKYIGDLALYYIAKKLESGQKTGTVKDAIEEKDIEQQLTGARLRPGLAISNDPSSTSLFATEFKQDEISAAIGIADNLLKLPEKKDTKAAEQAFKNAERNLEEFTNVET